MKLSSLQSPKTARLLLQAGLAAVFLYASLSSFLQPADWTTYLPNFLLTILPPLVVVKLFAFYELALFVWLVSSKYLKWAGLLCTLTLCGIIALNPMQLIITFRDIGLVFMALALVVLS